MGRALLVGRLAVRNLRRRPAEAALLLLAIMAATTTFTLGLVLHGVTDDPYDSTREATAGPDVVAAVGPSDVAIPGRQPPDDYGLLPADPAGLEALADAPGVVDHSGSHPAAVAELRFDDATADVWALGRSAEEDASVDQPQMTEGEWVEDGGVVVEAAFADVLGVDAGDEVTLGDRSFPVVGVAVTAAAGPYTDVCFAGRECPDGQGDVPQGQLPRAPADAPNLEPIDPDGFPSPPDDAGLVWLTEADVRTLAPDPGSLSYVINLRLDDPTAAPAFVEAHTSSIDGSPGLASWQDLRQGYDEVVREQREGLVAGGWLLAVLAVASIAVLVGGRIVDQTRRVGLLKAVGGSPGLVAAVLLAEYTILALVAAAGGLAVGWLAAPLLTDPGAGLVGSAGAPALTLSTVGTVAVAALGVVAVASLVPAFRAAFSSTVHALADRARRPRRMAWLIAVSARLPIPLLLGLRMAVRRPRRVLLSMASVVVTVSGIVAVLAARRQLAADWEGSAQLDPQADRLNQVLLVITVMLVTLAAVNAVFVTWATALDSQHSSAVVRAMGATTGQVGTGLSAAQIIPALVGSVVGIAGGLGLWTVLSNDEAVNPPLWQLLAVAPVTVLVVAVLTVVPARVGARRPTSQTLQSELA